MKKGELIRILRERIREKYPDIVAKRAVVDIIDEFLFILKEELQKGEDLIIPNFGIFKYKKIEKEGEERAFIRFIPSKK